MDIRYSYNPTNVLEIFFSLSLVRAQGLKRKETVKNEKLYWGGVVRKQPGRIPHIQVDQFGTIL